MPAAATRFDASGNFVAVWCAAGVCPSNGSAGMTPIPFAMAPGTNTALLATVALNLTGSTSKCQCVGSVLANGGAWQAALPLVYVVAGSNIFSCK